MNLNPDFVQGMFKGYIDGAMNYDVNSSDYTKRVKTLKKDQPVLIYCLSGVRSAKAATQLRKDGYSVFELKGGLLEWNARKKPVIKSATRGGGR